MYPRKQFCLLPSDNFDTRKSLQSWQENKLCCLGESSGCSAVDCKHSARCRLLLDVKLNVFEPSTRPLLSSRKNPPSSEFRLRLQAC